jgi:hypothetical protein
VLYSPDDPSVGNACWVGRLALGGELALAAFVQTYT